MPTRPNRDDDEVKTMEILVALVAMTAVLVLFDLAAVAFGAESREAFAERPLSATGSAR